jgi:AcrR family transcriptional regulator
MGNREDLLAGAAQCLREYGWARTTVRHIAAAAGVSHAAIGYHFGSREALLSAAFVHAMQDWGDEIDRATAATGGGSPAEPIAAMWAEMIRSFQAHPRLWRASMDALVQAEHAPELRRHLADGQEEGRRGAAAGLAGVPEPDIDERSVRSLGSVQMALISGVMVQWLIDPERAPTGADIVDGLRAIAGILGPRPADAPQPRRPEP